MSWRLTVRTGPRVQRASFASLEDALAALEDRADELAREASARPRAVNARVRRFEPVQQVVARLELAGPERMMPSVRGGIDVRGDGSTEAYVGRIRRRLVAQRRRETPVQALRRELAAAQSSSSDKPHSSKSRRA